MYAVRRVLTLALTSTVLIAGLAIPAHAGPEGTLVSRINSSRAAAGKAPLQTYWDLTDDARAHSSAMLNKGSIYHSPNLASVTGGWEKLGENVGVGVDANSLHDGFMSSSSHRSNILGDYNYVGVGVKTDAAGLMWVTVIFMKAAPGLNDGGTTTTTVAPTTTTLPPPADPPPSTSVDPIPETTPTSTKAPVVAKAAAAGGTAKAAPVAQKASSIAAVVVGLGRPPLLHPFPD